MKEKITVVIPTYNHPLYIKYIIDNSIVPYNGELFVFEIHDSSNTDETKEIVKKTRKIKYFKYDSNISADVKSHIAISQVNTSHIYLMGDGLAPNFNLLEIFLINSNFVNYDLFGILPSLYLKAKINKDIDIKPNEKYIFDNYQEFSKRFFYELTLYGGSIISNKILDYINENGLFEKYKFNSRYCYAHISSIFDALSIGKFSSAISFLDCIMINPIKKKSTWMNKELFFSILMDEFYYDVNKIPGYNPSIIKGIIENKNSFAFSLGFIINLRSNGILSLSEYRRHREKLNLYNSKKHLMKCVCFFPKWVCSLLLKIKNGVNK